MSVNEDATSTNSISIGNLLAVESRIKSDCGLPKERRYLCTICDIGFSTLPSLKDHLSDSHTLKMTSKSYFCQTCKKFFPYLSVFRTHLHREHTSEMVETCIKCHFQLPHSRVLPTRFSGEAYTAHYCVVCQAEKKANRRKIKEGIRPKSNGKKETSPGKDGWKKPYTCEVCQMSFIASRYLKRHLFAQHGVEVQNKPHHCTVCQREHVEGRPHVCSVCGKSFFLEYQLLKHSLKHRSPKERCDVCLKEVSRTYMPIHMRTHLGIKPYGCIACDNKFSSASKLKGHMIIHTGERPYVCEACGKGFTRSCHLKTHVRVHTGERPYVCEVCQRGFTQKWVLDAHRRIHTGERPFECDVCQRGFIYKSQLKTHQLKHCSDRSPN